MRGADLLVRTLAAHNVDTIFTLSGNQIMPVFDASVDAGPRLVHVRHEAAAVQMAEAHGQLTGEPGVALLTAGPGFANGLSALYGARASETPLLLLAGDAPSGQAGLGAFQELDQVAAAAPLAKAAWKVKRAEDMGVAVAEAWAVALSGRPGPVHLALPFDLLEAAVPAGLAPAPPRALEANAIDADTAGQVMKALARAERPLVLTGPRLCRHMFSARLAALGDALAAPVIGMESPRGLSDPSLGAFGDMMPRADLILLLGKAVDFAIGFGRAAPGSRFVHIDPDQGALARGRKLLGRRLVATHRADGAASIGPLLTAAAEAKPPARQDWLAEIAAALAYRPQDWAAPPESHARGLHPLEVFGAVQAFLDAAPNPILITDGGEFGQWALACLKARRWIRNGPSGAIGAGIPYAVAASLADPAATVVAISGDGSAGFHLAEYDTGARAGASPIVVIGNDARWNAEYQIQLRDYGLRRAIGVDLRDTDYDRVVEGLGGFGARVDAAPQLAPALKQAMASGKPAAINVRLDGQPAPRLRRAAAGDH